MVQVVQARGVEIQIALKVLLFFATFMAARSLTAYLDDKATERGE